MNPTAAIGRGLKRFAFTTVKCSRDSFTGWQGRNRHKSGLSVVIVSLTLAFVPPGALATPGAVDSSFDPGGLIADGNVRALALQPDGKVVVGGSFTLSQGSSRDRLMRLNPDGSLDASFQGGLAGPSGSVDCLALQNDGRILVGGAFTNINGVVQGRLARLNSDGTLDTNFMTGLPGANGSVAALALLPDGKIYIGGAFTSLHDVTRNRIARLHPDGTLDRAFQEGMSGLNGPVTCLAPDGSRLIVGGSFTTVNGASRPYLTALAADGARTFYANLSAGPDRALTCVLRVSTGALIGGSFTSVDNNTRRYFALLSGGGLLDVRFLTGMSGPDGVVNAIAVQADGNYLIAGAFAKVNGEARGRVARLSTTGVLDGAFLNGLTGANATINAMVVQPDGKILIGGNFTNVNGVVRSRIARVTGFDDGPAVITTQPQSQTNTVGRNVTFSVAVTGPPPYSYQWNFNGATLAGATNRTLTVNAIQTTNAGIYTVTVSNPFGAVTSAEALLRVNQYPVADASTTRTMNISANGTNATVLLDGSLSYDPDGDLLKYTWSEAGATLATGVVAVVELPVGAHTVQLSVNDGRVSASSVVMIEVLTTSQVVERLQASASADVARAQPLLASLSAALASIDRSNPVSAINQLLAFQNQVRAQVEPLDAALAARFLQQAQEVIDTLSGGGTNPGGRPHGRFTAVERQSNGRVTLQFTGEPGLTYIVEASTNLVEWEMIGVAAEQGDGAFRFVDSNTVRFPNRYYRLVMP